MFKTFNLLIHLKVDIFLENVSQISLYTLLLYIPCSVSIAMICDWEWERVKLSKAVQKCEFKKAFNFSKQAWKWSVPRCQSWHIKLNYFSPFSILFIIINFIVIVIIIIIIFVKLSSFISWFSLAFIFFTHTKLFSFFITLSFFLLLLSFLLTSKQGLNTCLSLPYLAGRMLDNTLSFKWWGTWSVSDISQVIILCSQTLK